MKQRQSDTCYSLTLIRRVIGLALLITSFTLSSCQDFHDLDSVRRNLPGFDTSRFVQEGQVLIWAWDEVKVTYKKPFQSPPQIAPLEIGQSWFRDRPYSKADFEITEQDAKGFKLKNKHQEQYPRSCAVIKWRAEGIGAEH
jgi:hypothetical protein